MSEERIHFDDPEFRLSRYLDGELDADESRRLERDLQADAELRRLLEQYRGANQFVKASAGPVPEPDWDRFGRHILWRCGAAYAARPYRTLYRIGVPLAAAAAIVLAFTRYMRSTPRLDPKSSPMVVDSRPTRPGVTVKEGAEGPEVSVVFTRTPLGAESVEARTDGADAGEDESEDGSYVIAAAGASPLDDGSVGEEPAPTF